jgi:predicted neuraminidase
MRDTRPDGRITAVQTQDGGQHWSDVPDLRETNPDAAVAGLTLAPGQSLLAHNTSPHSRELLDLSASANGLDWIGLQTLAHGVPGDEFSYPAVAWADDALWVSYTDHRRSIAWQRLAIPGPAPTPAGAKP